MVENGFPTCTAIDEDGNPLYVYAAQITVENGLASLTPVRCNLVPKAIRTNKPDKKPYWVGGENGVTIVVNEPGKVEVLREFGCGIVSDVNAKTVGDMITFGRLVSTVLSWTLEKSVFKDRLPPPPTESPVK